jgi:osmoprotectant transport system substrate-binding protein
MRSLLLVLLLLVTGCSVTDPEVTSPAEPQVDPIRVAAGPDAESLLLGHVIAAALELSDVPSEVVLFTDARDSRQALDLGAVDLRVGYTGEAWLETLGRADPPGEVRQSFLAVRDFDERQGIVWLRPRFGDGPSEPPANATFAFVVQGPPSIDADLRTMSQLAARLSEQPDARVCVDREFGARPDGLRAVLAAYSVRTDREFLAADAEEAVLGVLAGDCLAGLVTATDGRVWRAGLRPLEDDLRVFPAFVPLPQVREEVLVANPAVRGALGPISAQLSTELLGGFNARVVAGESIEEVADDAVRVLFELAGRTLEVDETTAG